MGCDTQGTPGDGHTLPRLRPQTAAWIDWKTIDGHGGFEMALDSQDKVVLSEFAIQYPRCWICDSDCHLEIHHICGRRGKRPHDRRNLARLCRRCHSCLHSGCSINGVTDANVLFAKRQHDGENYDPSYLAGLRHRVHLGYEPERAAWVPPAGVIAFSVPGTPVPQPRPRVSMAGGHARAYVPKSHPVHAYRDAIGLCAARAGLTQTSSPVRVAVGFVFARPASHLRGSGLRAGAPLLPRPDVDNLAKAVLDGLSGYFDDTMVEGLIACKTYGSEACTEVAVETVAAGYTWNSLRPRHAS